MSIGVKNFSPKKLKKRIEASGYNKSRFINHLCTIAANPKHRLLRIFPNARHLNRHLDGETAPTMDYIKLYAKALDCSIPDLLNGRNKR